MDWFDWRWRRIATGFGRGFGVTEGDAGGGVEDAADGPSGFVGRVFSWEEDFAGALLFGAIVPAAEEGEVVGEGSEIGG